MMRRTNRLTPLTRLTLNLAASAGLALPQRATAISGPINLFGVPYYSTGTAEILALLLALPIFLGALLFQRRSGWRQRLRRAGLRTLVLLVIWEVATNAGIYQTSQRMQRVCAAHGGLRIYQPIQARGFLGSGSIEYWHRAGFEFVESQASDGVIHWTMVDGRVDKRRVHTPQALYRLDSRTLSVPRLPGATRHAYAIRALDDERILGELNYYTLRPRGVDRLLPLERGVWTCGSRTSNADAARFGPSYDATDLIHATLLAPP